MWLCYGLAVAKLLSIEETKMFNDIFQLGG